MVEAIQKDNAYIVVFENITPKEQDVLNQVKLFIAKQNEKPAHQISIKEYEANKDRFAEEARKEADSNPELQVTEQSMPKEPAQKIVFKYRRNAVQKNEERIVSNEASGIAADKGLKREQAESVENKGEVNKNNFARRKPSGFVYRRDESEISRDYDLRQAKKEEEANRILKDKAKEEAKEAEEAFKDAFSEMMNAPVSDDEKNTVSGDLPFGSSEDNSSSKSARNQDASGRKKLNIKGKLKFIGNSDKSDAETKEIKQEGSLTKIYDCLYENVLSNPFLSDAEKKEIAANDFHYDLDSKAFDKNYDFSSFDMSKYKAEYKESEIADKAVTPAVAAPVKSGAVNNDKLDTNIGAMIAEKEEKSEPEEWEQMEFEM